MQLQPCHICASTNLADYMDVKSYKMTKCTDCNHVQVNPIPSEEVLLGLYQNGNGDSFYGNSCSVSLLEKSRLDKKFLTKYYSERIDTINDILSSQTAAVLDFGCTNGLFVKAITESGYQNAFGYDVAEALIEEGKENNLNLFTGELNVFSTSFKNFFDLVLSYHVFEHLASPRKILTELRICLKGGGYLYINVPHINSLQVRLLKKKSAIIDPPYHLHYFTKKSLIRLLEDQGFEIVKITTPFWEKSTDTYLEMMGFGHKAAVILRHIVAPLRGVIRFLCLGGNIAVLARKKHA